MEQERKQFFFSSFSKFFLAMAAEERGLLIVKVCAGRDLRWSGFTSSIGFEKMQPFVTVYCEDIKLGNTGPQRNENSKNPVWNEFFFGIMSTFLPDSNHHSKVYLELRDYDGGDTYTIAKGQLRPVAASIDSSTWKPEWISLEKKKGKGDLQAFAVLVPMSEAYKMNETPASDFLRREGCSVRLYQDAWCPSLLPHIPPRNAFEDIYQSLMAAKKFIYLSGWSVWTKLYLLRDKPCPLLGDLLLQKSNEGVQVCVLIWDEFTSFESQKKEEVEAGLMNTFDEETRNFFKETKVSLQANFRAGYMGTEEAFFSHHQKTIICDENDQVTAYVGGLDLTNGRWDTPEHSLFSTLKTTHQNDYYNGCAPGLEETGPRQPWHDIHSRLEGQIALDVLENFKQRWSYNALNYNSNLGECHEKVEYQPTPLHDLSQMNFAKGGSWNCQLLRSIDSYSIGDSESRSQVVRSIQNTYVLRIATAQRFLYIENQYFMGSSHYWDATLDPGLRNLIPIAIVEKIISKIAAKEDFVAYVIIPMFPEGAPDSIQVQALLRWQFNTYRMMYERIRKALKKYQSQKKVEDFFVLMCLGTREDPTSFVDAEKSEHETTQNGRHMIYVHSKMIIVDDEFILVGSANINDRSMRGNRDTEIAVVCDQRTPDSFHSQEIQDFRLSLWVEHFGATNSSLFHTPNSPVCNLHIREVAEKNWESYKNQTWTKMESHACRYPYHFEDGEVTVLQEYFPDFPDARVKGEASIIPNTVTT